MHTHTLGSGKQERAPLCDRSQNLPISSEHDLTYDVITWWPDMTSTWNFHSSQYMSNWSTRGYCKFRGDPPHFTRVIREKPWGVRSTPLQVRGLTWPVFLNAKPALVKPYGAELHFLLILITEIHIVLLFDVHTIPMHYRQLFIFGIGTLTGARKWWYFYSWCESMFWAVPSSNAHFSENFTSCLKGQAGHFGCLWHPLTNKFTFQRRQLQACFKQACFKLQATIFDII